MFNNILAHTSFIGETGYNSHSRKFFTALNKYIPVKIRNFTIGKKWDGLSDYPHEAEGYLTAEHRNMLFKQTVMDNKRTDHFIYNSSDSDLKGDFVNIVLNETNHYYFYDRYDGIKIAYNVWESTLQPNDYFNKLMEYDQLWVPSKWQKECSIKQGFPPDKVRIIPEGVDGNIFFPEKINEKRLLKEYKDDRFKFLLFGRWDYRKSTYEIIKTFLGTFDKDEKVDLIISVDNSYSIDGLGSTKERLEYYQLQDYRIKIKHFVSRSDYIQYLKTGHVFVSCARSEGWNLPLIEAMACGSPSIYSNWGAQLQYAEGLGCPVNIIEERPAFLGEEYSYSDMNPGIPGNYCEPDFQHLGQVMRSIYRNYEEHKKGAIKESKKIRNEFKWSITAKKAYNCLKELGDHHGGYLIKKKPEKPEISIKFSTYEKGGKTYPKIYFYPIKGCNNRKFHIEVKENKADVGYKTKFVFNDKVEYWIIFNKAINDLSGLSVDIYDGAELFLNEEIIYNGEEIPFTIINGVKVVPRYKLFRSGLFSALKTEFDRNIYENHFKVEDGDVVVDLGAQIGMFSLSILDRDIDRCYCVEPDIRNYYDLTENIKKTGQESKFVLIRKAIDNQTGTSFFRLNSGFGVCGKSDSKNGVSLPTVSFQDFIRENNIDYIDFLKMDCEGGEYYIFNKEENRNYLKNNVGKIVGEIHLKNNKENFVKLIQNLNNLEFEVIVESVDGINITNRFMKKLDYYTELIIHAKSKRNREKYK